MVLIIQYFTGKSGTFFVLPWRFTSSPRVAEALAEAQALGEGWPFFLGGKK